MKEFASVLAVKGNKFYLYKIIDNAVLNLIIRDQIKLKFIKVIFIHTDEKCSEIVIKGICAMYDIHPNDITILAYKG